MLYDQYRKKITRFATALAWVKRFRLPIILIAVSIVAVISVLLSISGIVFDSVPCPVSVTYGDSLGYRAKAIFSDVRYEYAPADSETWSDRAPLRAGNYRVRGVADGPFGTRRYGSVHFFSVSPKEVDVFVTQKEIGFGELPSVDADLAYSDKIHCSRFVFGDLSRPDSTVVADKDAITVTDAEGQDVTDSYFFRPLTATIGFIPREITVTVRDKSQIYDGNELMFDGYELSADTPLAEGDTLIAVFEARRTDAGETKNVPKIKVVKGRDALDVSGNYRIRIVPGKLRVEQRPLYFETGSAEKVYDGTPLICDDFRIRAPEKDSGLLDGHEVFIKESCRATDAVTVDNVPKFLVRDAGGRDVSENYSIFFDKLGKLKVKQRPVTVTTGDGEWVYDGMAHENSDYEVLEGTDGESGLLAGHRHELDTAARLVDAGTLDNVITISIFDGKGREVTNNYDVRCDSGTLTVSRRSVVFETTSRTWTYDGETHSEFGHSLWSESPNGLVKGHETRAETGAKIVYRGSCKNVLDIRIYSAEGRAMTDNYAVSCRMGDLTVLPRPITVTAGSAERVYDGTPLETDDFETACRYGDALVGNHFGVAENEGSQTDAGSSKNVVRTFFVFDGERNVTDNYEITIAEGTLRVYPRPVTVTAGSAEKVYDGTPLICDDFEAVCKYGDAFVGNHFGVAVIDGSQTDAFSSWNVVRTFFVYEGSRDVTFNYEIEFFAGTLTVFPRPILVETSSRSWVYDGDSHGDRGHMISDKSEFPLVKGHRTEAFGGTHVTDVGSVENVLAINVLSENGDTNVTFNYEIKLDCGTLEIEPRPITVRPESREKVYDGLPLKSDKISIESKYDPAIVKKQSVYFELDGSQTDAGTGVCAVSFFAVFDEYNRNVTTNYALTCLTGALTVTPRPVTIRARSFENFYTGMPQSSPFTDADWEEEGTERGLLHWHSLFAETQGSRTDVGQVPNVVLRDRVRITEEGRDVTLNYKITYADGIIKILPRPITVIAGSAEKMYDGTPLTSARFECFCPVEGWDALAPGERIEVRTSGSRTEIGRSDNIPESVRILSGERDVTKNYEIEGRKGVLTVQIPDGFVRIRTDSATKMYDGTPLECKDYTVTNTLPENYRVEIFCDGSIVGVGETKNTAVLKVTGASGEDVTELIRAEYEFGTLRVTPRPVVVETGSNSWPFDGNTHFEPFHRVSPESQYGFVNDHFSETCSVTQIFDVGRKRNELEIRVYSLDREDMTENYQISYLCGTLEITESGFIGGGNLDTSGNIGLGQGGGGGSGGGSGTVTAKVLSEAGGMVYLRLMNFGDYTGRNWEKVASYSGLLDGIYSMNYLTSAALQGAGYSGSRVSIEVKGKDYLLPYYMSLGASGYDIQTSDVYYRGDTSLIYELSYIFYDFISAGELGVDLGKYAYAEMGYRSFVHANYLNVPGSTLSYLNTVIRREGFRKSDADIVNKVASYIQNAAKYNLEYDRLLDAQSDIVVSFLRDVREGVCQHYASAATMLFRALGIPARYTIGYAGETKPGEWTEFTSQNAHAWVEVYLDGMGWVHVEVTGAGPVFSDGTGETLTLKPADCVKQYDGLPLTASAVVGADKDAFAFRELLNAGYTYRAEYAGAQTNVGDSFSSIVSFALFRPDGTEETKFTFKFRTGKLKVVDRAVVTVHPFSLQKYYDGTPLAYRSGDYYVTGLPAEYTLHLNLSGVGITDAGILGSERLENLPLKIADGAGREVTKNFYVHFDTEALLMVSRRKITVASVSMTKEYDGEPLTCGDFWIAEGSLAEGHKIFVEMSSSITDIGETRNVIENVRIKDAAGNDVTHNYDVQKIFGTLTVVGS